MSIIPLGPATSDLLTEANLSLDEIDGYSASINTKVATSAKQDTGNTSLASIDTKTPALVGGKVPVDPSGTTQTVSGTVAVTQPAQDNTNNVNAEVIKPLAVSTYCYSLSSNLTASATQNVKTTSGNVYSLMCQSVSNQLRYFQLHNTASTPSASATPQLSFPVPAGTTIVIGTDFFGPNGLNFTTGIAMAFSTTRTVYTAGSAADVMAFVTYK